jgi:sporulation protein YlmC with PRC-barrel domain
MKVTEFLGIRVVDNQGMEIGKVSEVIIDPKEAEVMGIHISTGEFGLRRKDLYITPSQIAEVGDYILLNIARVDVSEVSEESDNNNSSKTSITID